MFLLPHLLRRFVRHGELILRNHDGVEHRFGSGVDGPRVTMRLMDAKVERERMAIGREVSSAKVALLSSNS